MPNWCNNFVQIRHEDPAKLQALAEAVREGKFCDYIWPCPQELRDTVAGHCGDGYKQELNQFKMELNRKYFGHKDWYDWCVANWGTKWDIDAYDASSVSAVDGLVSFGFDSAWAPPTGLYEKMAEQGYQVDAMYYESGMGFCGRWIDGNDDYYEISGMSSDQVAAEIDSDIDEQFGISENMAQWEAEQEENQNG